jgi:5-methylcytosine-specific restriction endonuclease McrA
MKKELLIKLIERELSTREISKETNKSQTTVKYWLHKYGLKTNPAYYHLKHKCKCGETDPKNFYGKQKRPCRRCRDLESLEKQKRKRKFAIDLLGGKCSNCGYDIYIGALDIHHNNPHLKDSEFKNMRSWSEEKIKKELEDCILLCSNCHREFHKQ